MLALIQQKTFCFANEDEFDAFALRFGSYLMYFKLSCIHDNFIFARLKRILSCDTYDARHVPRARSSRARESHIIPPNLTESKDPKSCVMRHSK